MCFAVAPLPIQVLSIWRSAGSRNPHSFRWWLVMLGFLLSSYRSSVSSELVTSRNNICKLYLTSQIYVTHLTIQLFLVRRSPVWNKDTRWFSLILFIYLSNNAFYMILIITYKYNLLEIFLHHLFVDNYLWIKLTPPTLLTLGLGYSVLEWNKKLKNLFPKFGQFFKVWGNKNFVGLFLRLIRHFMTSGLSLQLDFDGTKNVQVIASFFLPSSEISPCVRTDWAVMMPLTLGAALICGCYPETGTGGNKS